MTDYCTVADVKADGRLDITGTEYDATLAELVTAASRWIDQYCCAGISNAFAAGDADTAVRYYDAAAIVRSTLHLDAPLLAVDAITNGDGAGVTSGYRLEPLNGQTFRRVKMLSTGPGWTFPTDASEIAITGVWGLSAFTPPAIREACAMLAGWMFKRYQTALADASANVELGQLVYGESMPRQVVAILDTYRESYLV